MITKKIQWSDEVYAELENGVSALVRSLHLLGIRTIMSCEGHIRTLPIYTGILPWPWVIIQVNKEERDILARAISLWNELNPLQRWILSERRVHGSFTPEYIREYVIKDFPGESVTALVPEDENVRLDPNVLISAQKQADELARFLQKPS